MLDPALQMTLDQLRAGFAERLGLRGSDLGTVLRRAGRQVPRRLRPAAAVLVEAEKMAVNPRLARLIDGARVAAAARELDDWLATQDPRERRRTRIINSAALGGFYMLATAGLVIGVLVWRGIV
jgi:hypothetical protein